MLEAHRCVHCGILKTLNFYQLYKGKPNGWCRGCKTRKEAERRLSKGITPRVTYYTGAIDKECRLCRKTLPIGDFSPTERGSAKVSAYCKPCAYLLRATKYRASQTKGRVAYRKTGNHKANNRVLQFNRKQRIKVQSDGTVTKDFLKGLYETTTCHYCCEEIEVKFRTADHKKPLIKGGLHSAVNLVMACLNCNSSKGSMDYEDFINDNHRESACRYV